MRNPRALGTILLIATLSSHAWAQDNERAFSTTDTFLAISGITEAGAPRVVDELLVFTYEPSEFARHVAVAFAHEGYRRLHTFAARERENLQDLFYLTWLPPTELTEVEYRYVVDGAWIVDPKAAETRTDRYGVRRGVVRLQTPAPHRWELPRINGDGTATFGLYFDVRVAAAFDTVDGRYVSVEQFSMPRVNLVSNRNAWDPFAHQMVESREYPGLYTATVPVRPGSFHYYYMVDGERILDPYNRNTARNLDDGYLVSLLEVP